MTGNEHLNEAIHHLSNAIASDKAPLSCAQGLRALTNAAGVGSLDPALTAEASRLLFEVAPRVSDQMAGRLAQEHVFHSLGCMNAALTTPDRDRFPWLLAAAAVLENELRALHLRDMIATSNQPDLASAIVRNPLSAAFYDDGPITTH